MGEDIKKDLGTRLGKWLDDTDDTNVFGIIDWINANYIDKSKVEEMIEDAFAQGWTYRGGANSETTPEDYDSYLQEVKDNTDLVNEVFADRVTRVEVIDENGRSYVNQDPSNKVELSYQDDGRTLKIFITK